MRASLLQRGVELYERDFFADRLSEDELRNLIGDRPASDLFSWNSPSFRKMGVPREELDEDRMIALMLEEPRLIRRPLVRIGDALIVGAGKAALDEALGPS